MIKRGMALAGVGFGLVLLFQNCARTDADPHAITSSAELAKASSTLSCEWSNLVCRKRRYSPTANDETSQVRECISLSGQEVCLNLDFQSYNSSNSSTETRERLEYSCWLGPVEQAAAFALRSTLTEAVIASLTACQEGGVR